MIPFIDHPAGKFAEKAVWRSVFLTKWHCILNANSTKTECLQSYILAILPVGQIINILVCRATARLCRVVQKKYFRRQSRGIFADFFFSLNMSVKAIENFFYGTTIKLNSAKISSIKVFLCKINKSNLCHHVYL